MSEFTRNNYREVESFTAANGREYLEVEWKGIDQTGFISRIEGPGRTITRDWYKRKKRQNEEDEEDEEEDTGTRDVEDPGVYRTILYAGTDYRPSQTRVELAVWIIQESPDANVSVDDLERTWWRRAKGIGFREIGPVVGEISDIPDGVEENERIDRDEVRRVDRPLGKVNAAILVERGFGSYGYKVDFSRGTLDRDDRYATLAPAIDDPDS